MGQIMLQPTDAHIGHRQPGAGQILDNPDDQLARFDHVKADGNRPQLR